MNSPMSWNYMSLKGIVFRTMNIISYLILPERVKDVINVSNTGLCLINLIFLSIRDKSSKNAIEAVLLPPFCLHRWKMIPSTCNASVMEDVNGGGVAFCSKTLTSLQPATRYAVYVESKTLFSQRGAISNIIYFNTTPSSELLSFASI